MKRILTMNAVFFAALGAFAYDADTLALYDFKGGEAETTIQNTAFANLVDSSQFAGTPSGDAEKGVYDADRPGKYVFEIAKRGATPIITDPQSVRFSGAKVAFADVGSELSAHDSWTVEFFFKFEPGAAMTYSGSLSMNCGLLYNPPSSASEAEKALTGTAQPLKVVFRSDVIYTCLRDPSTHVTSVRSSSEGLSDFRDGTWHHYACTYSAAERTYRMYLDYAEALAAHTTTTGSVLAASSPMTFGEGFNGRIACPRVSKVIRRVPEFLHASSRPDFIEEKVFHWRLNGTPDATILSGINHYAPENPFVGQFIGRQAVSGAATVVVPSNTDSPTYSTSVPNTPRRRIVFSGDEEIGENATSGFFPIKQRTSELYMLADSGLKLAGGDCYPVDAGSFTVEMFARLDLEGWSAKTTGTSYPRFTIFSMRSALGVDRQDYGMRMTQSGDTWYFNALPDSAGNGTSKMDSWPCTSLVKGGEWHHYAIVYDDEKLTSTFYIDGVIRGLVEYKEPLMADSMLRSSRNLQIGYGANNHPFQGWFDEIRMVRRALDPSEFLTFKNTDGLLLLLR